MTSKWMRPIERCRRTVATAALVLACALFIAPGEAGAGDAGIKVCKDAKGRPVATDRTDPRCHQPPPTLVEEADREERRRREMDAFRACMVEQRALQGLLSRYPDKARHDQAREAAMAEVKNAMAVSEERMRQLLKERQRLREEAEFYPNGLPPKLQLEVDSNNALISAQTQAIDNLRVEAARQNAIYDKELVKLRRLWQPHPPEARCVAPSE